MNWYREVYLRSEDWKNLRAAVLAAPIWQGRCWICQHKKKRDVHHLRYRRLYNVRLSDLIPLCRTCHTTLHTLLKDNLSSALTTRIPTCLFSGKIGRFRYVQFRLWEILCRVRGPRRAAAIIGLIQTYPEHKKFVDKFAC